VFFWGDAMNFEHANKTIYTFIDLSGGVSTLTLDKWISDVLEEECPDVHLWVQSQYNRLTSLDCSRGSGLSRRAVGDLIRLNAAKFAGKCVILD